MSLKKQLASTEKTLAKTTRELNEYKQRCESLEYEIVNLKKQLETCKTKTEGKKSIEIAAGTVSVPKKTAKCKFCKRQLKECNADPCEKKLYKKLNLVENPNTVFEMKTDKLSVQLLEQTAGFMQQGDVILFREIVLKYNKDTIKKVNKSIVVYKDDKWQVDDRLIDDFFEFACNEYKQYLQYLAEKKRVYSQNDYDLDATLLNKTMNNIANHMILMSRYRDGLIETPKMAMEKKHNTDITKSLNYKKRFTGLVLKELAAMAE